MEKKPQAFPKGWGTAKLGDVIVFVIGGDWGKELAYEARDYVEVLCIRGSEFRNWHQDRGKTASIRKVKISSLKNRRLQEGDIILEISGGGPDQPVGRTELIEKSVLLYNPKIPKICTNFLRLMRPSNEISAEFLNYFLKFFYSTGEIVRYQAGSNNLRNLKFDSYMTINIPLAPLVEQKRIVDKIERLFSDLDKGEENLRTAQRQLATYRQSVLKAAMSGELIGTDSGNWPKQSLGELITDIRYGTAKKCLHDPSKTAVLRIPNVVSGKIDLTNLKHTNFEPAEIKKLALKKGDVLLVRSNGSVSLVGRSAVVGKEAEGCAYAGYLIRLRLKQDQILPDFLHLFLLSPGTRAHVERQARSTSGVHNINSDEVKSLSLSLPSIDEQMAILDKIEDIFSRISALEKWCATELIRSATLRQSILKAAFSGQLVSQDANDEPASVLLTRIQAARANAPKVKSVKHIAKRKVKIRKAA